MNYNKKGVLKRWATKGLIIGLSGFLAGYLLTAFKAGAQVPPPPITSSGLNTQVSAPVTPTAGGIQYNITGGTRPGGGLNLFHSFGEFGVPTNNIANFLNESGKPTTTILSRVTGGNRSNILGTIQTEGFGNANLFLMNPAGIVFGSDASLNVGGATHFTTADYLRLADGVQFTALPGAQDALLSIAPVAAFGFLGPNPGAISVDGSTLSVGDGQTLSLVGGDITIGSGLNAPGGKIGLASVASPGEVLADTFASAPNVNGDSFTTTGTLVLSEGAKLDVSNEAAGTVIIRGGELMMTNALISADTVNENGAPVGIDIDVTRDLSISTIDGPALTARTSGIGNAGEVKLTSGGAVDIAGTGIEEFLIPMIDTHTSGPGNAGNVTITSQGDMTVTGDLTFFALTFLADTGTDGFDTGKGGDLSITAQNFTGVNSFISTGNFFSSFNDGEGAGPAGNVTISTAGKIDLTFSDIITDSFDFFFDTGGDAGDVTLTAQEINFHGSNISTGGWFRGGNVTINTDTLVVSESDITTQTRTEPGGAVTVTGKTIELIGSNIISTTNENANAGDITIAATESVSLLNIGPFSDFDKPSSIASNSFSFSNDGIGILGAPGSIRIATPNLVMDGGSKINSSSGSSGNGGPVIINSETISMSGQTGNKDVGDLRNFGEFQSSGIFTGSLGGSCAGPCGDAGNVDITTGSIAMDKGAQVNSSTSTDGRGGNIYVKATDTISISGTLEDGTSGGVLSRSAGTESGSGHGGNITLTGGNSFYLKDGATVSASTSGPGNAGTITMGATDKILVIDSSVLTKAEETGTGGAITIGAHSIELDNATLSASVKDGADQPGGGHGDITLTTPTLLMTGGEMTAETLGTRAAGTITLDTGTVLVQNEAKISALTSADGGAGSITIKRGNLTLHSGAQIEASTTGSGKGGTIVIKDMDDVVVSGRSADGKTPSGIVANTKPSSTGIGGGGGDITISARNLLLNDGAHIDSSTTSGGAGGRVSLTATDTITIEGANSRVTSDASQGNGTGGSIKLEAGELTMRDGSSVTAQTGGIGDAGNISITTTTGSLNVTEGAVINSGTTGTGAGGTIFLKADQNFTLSDGATVSASSSGPGNAGDITITAGDTILLDKAMVNTEAESALGGNIKFTADNQIDLTDSQVTSRVQAGSGSAGSINLDPDFIVLKNSEVLSTAVSGNGGNITLTANSAILVDPFSNLDARSQFGGSGSVDIQAPTKFLSGTIAPLPQNPAPVTALYGTRCVAGEGGHFSTFVDSKVDSLAPPPGTFLASPFLPLANSSSVAAQGHGESPSEVSEPGHAAHLQLAAYVPPVLFGQSAEMLTACP